MITTDSPILNETFPDALQASSDIRQVLNHPSSSIAIEHFIDCCPLCYTETAELLKKERITLYGHIHISKMHTSDSNWLADDEKQLKKLSIETAHCLHYLCENCYSYQEKYVSYSSWKNHCLSCTLPFENEIKPGKIQLMAFSLNKKGEIIETKNIKLLNELISEFPKPMKIAFVVYVISLSVLFVLNNTSIIRKRINEETFDLIALSCLLGGPIMLAGVIYCYGPPNGFRINHD